MFAYFAGTATSLGSILRSFRCRRVQE